MRTPVRWWRPLGGVDSVGPGATVVGRPIINNSGRIRIGRDFRFSASPAISHLAAASEGVIEIGDSVSIDHGAAIYASNRVSIGDGARIGAYCVIMDDDFHRAGEFLGSSLNAPIVVGRNARIGAGVVLLRGAVIGENAEVAPGSVVGEATVAPGSRVAGVPARSILKQDERGAGDPALVPRIVAATLGLAALPGAADELAVLPGWESLAQLRLLLALEDALGPVASDGFARARTVADLIALAGSGDDGRAGLQASRDSFAD